MADVTWTSETVPIAGAALHVARAGSGTPLLLLHHDIGTLDNLPVIGSSRRLPNLMYATGHYRNGVLLAPLTAQLVADAMLDNRIDPMLEVVRPSRFGDL